MRGKEQRRAWIMTKLLVSELNVAAAGALAQLSQPKVRRLPRRFEVNGS